VEKESMMIKIYGMSTCPDCTYLYDQIEGREEYEMIDIGTHVKLLKEFLKIRDNSPVFDECKEKGYAGIPCFVLEDGTITLEPERAGLKGRPVEEH
jgi:glutaredoxin-related protein